MTHIRTVSPSNTSEKDSSATDEPSSPQRRMKRPETFSILGQIPVGEKGKEGWLWSHSLRGFPQSLGLEQPHKTHVDPFYRWGC